MCADKDDEECMACSNPCHVSHSRHASSYPMECVPRKMFEKRKGAGLYRTCSDCRDYDAECRTRVRKRRRVVAEKAGDSELYPCIYCNHPRIKEYCCTCEQWSAKGEASRVIAYDRVILERIRDVGTCCELCRSVFLKAPSGTHGFITVGTLDGVNQDCLELRNLEFDHLNEQEQIERFGYFNGHKKKGVPKEISYVAQKEESAKCKLVCLSCHVRETMRRYKIGKPASSDYTKPGARDKTMFITAEKHRLRGCTRCKHFDPTNLPYYEFDHIDATTKIKTISQLERDTSSSIADLKAELAKCRLLCRFCHRKRTSIQWKETHATRRAAGAAKYAQIVSNRKDAKECLVEKILRELDEMTSNDEEGLVGKILRELDEMLDD